MSRHRSRTATRSGPTAPARSAECHIQFGSGGTVGDGRPDHDLAGQLLIPAQTAPYYRSLQPTGHPNLQLAKTQLLI